MSVKANNDGIVEILQSAEVRTEVSRIADQIGQQIVNATGEVDGRAVTARREHDSTKTRVREAILLLHPSPRGRKAAAETAKGFVQ